MYLGVVANELDAVAGVDGGGAEPALLQPHRAASSVNDAAAGRQTKPPVDQKQGRGVESQWRE
jgi:hypothetical protein